jgi:hypothetical protein
VFFNLFNDGISTSKYITSNNTLIVNRKGFGSKRLRLNLIHCFSICLREEGKPLATSGLSISW